MFENFKIKHVDQTLLDTTFMRGEKCHGIRVYFSRAAFTPATRNDPAEGGETTVEEIWLVPWHRGKDAPKRFHKRIEAYLTDEERALIQRMAEEAEEDTDYDSELEAQREYWRHEPAGYDR